MVFQSYALYPHMSVRGNIAFALKMAKQPKDVIDKKVAKAAATLNLTDYLDRKPRQLSGGQRQRVAIGRAIVREPKAFLFDEPLSNLDAKLRVAMRSEIKELHQRLKTTSIYVTHDQIEAMTMADKIVVMNSGNVEQIGAPLELYDRPNNLFVAGFIGSPAMNFLKGRVEGVFFDVNGTRLPMPTASSGSNGAPVIYGIRPEHWRLTPDGVDAIVHVIEPTGSETQVMAHIAGAPVLCAFRERVSARPGEAIRVAPDPTLVHLFDQATGARLN
jgi:multiple sugar transport system ATP-binding protein